MLFDKNVDEINELELNKPLHIYGVRDGNTYRIYYRNRHQWNPLYEETFDNIISYNYFDNYLIFVKSLNTKKEHLLTLPDIHQAVSEIEIEGNPAPFNTKISADEFYGVKDDGLETGLPIIIARNGDQFNYILPHRRFPIVVSDIDFGPCHHGVAYFIVNNRLYVYVAKKDNKKSIYTIEGKHLGDFDYFSIPIDCAFSVVQIDWKWNYYSFEKKDIYFDKWFDEEDLPCVNNGVCVFPVADNDICKIIDENGNDISSNHKELLSKWKKDYEELSELHKNWAEEAKNNQNK